MMALFAVHTAVVETYTGPTPTGDGYAAPVSVPGFLDDAEGLQRNAQGEQVVGETAFRCALTFSAGGLSYVAWDVFTPQSRVTVKGRVMQVKSRHEREAGPMFSLVEHLEVTFE